MVEENNANMFEEEYSDFQNQWEDTHRSLARGGLSLLRQSDLKFGETRLRMVLPAGFKTAWRHSVQDTNGKWKRLVCSGRKEIMKDKSLRPRMDPEACLVCSTVLADQNQRGYPRFAAYFYIFNRINQNIADQQEDDYEIEILEAGPQLYDAIFAIATSEDYKRDIEKDGVAKSIIDLTQFDIIINKKKTGSRDVDVEYSCLAGGRKTWVPFTDKENAAIAKGLPSMDWLIDPPSTEKIRSVFNGETDGGSEEPEPRGKRTSKPNTANGDVPFDA